MTVPRFGRNILRITLIAALTLSAGGAGYSSVSVDQSGQLHIVLDSGKEILPQKVPGETLRQQSYGYFPG